MASQAQIGCDGFADLDGNGIWATRPPLPWMVHPTVVPIDIIQFQCNNLAGSTLRLPPSRIVGKGEFTPGTGVGQFGS
jgi:hypothetical protein